ncbi:hypothetical protein [Streptomyces sp. NPDC053755]|uniref:hypothetical protein n=1 Tax=Streptomyces sp. NPDC053755 TaxID=3155815 RepID=UPI00342BC8F7
MDDYAWPTGPNGPAPQVLRRGWAATVEALPVGSRVTGEVDGRRRFGAFLSLDGFPEAVASAEITAMPPEMELPAPGARVEGEAVPHAGHDRQVRVELHGWATPDALGTGDA